MHCMDTVFTMIGTFTISFLMQKQSNLQMDFMFCLDGAIWVSRAHHTSIADGEPKLPICAGCVVGGVMRSVTGSGWSPRRALARGGDVALTFCLPNGQFSDPSYCYIQILTESWCFLKRFRPTIVARGDEPSDDLGNDRNSLSLHPSGSVRYNIDIFCIF
jgi:hypothetical protein